MTNERNRPGELLRLIDKATAGHRWIWSAAAALSLVRLAHQCVKFLYESPSIDLGLYYFYSSMIRMGLDPYHAPDIAAARALLPMKIAGGEVWYAPGFFVLFQPLTLIPFGILRGVWLAGSLAFVGASCLLILRRTDGETRRALVPFACLLVALYQPLYEDLALGQINTALLFIATATWWGWRRDLPWLTGGGLAAMAFLKVHYGFLAVFLLLAGRVRAFFIAAAVWLALFSAGFLEVGLAYYRNYLAAFLRQVQLVGGYAYNISPNGVWQRVFGEGHPAATLLHLGLSLALVAWILRRCRQGALREAPATQMLFALILLPLISPYTEEHHLVPLLLPLLAAAPRVADLPPAWRAAYVAAAVVLASRYSLIRFEPLPSAWLAPLAGLKMAGVLALLAVLLRMSPATAPDPEANLPPATPTR